MQDEQLFCTCSANMAWLACLQAESLIEMYMSSDPKLRGFGAAAVVQEGEHYRLFCGLGIKNLHVWAFKPTPPQVRHGEAWDLGSLRGVRLTARCWVRAGCRSGGGAA